MNRTMVHEAITALQREGRTTSIHNIRQHLGHGSPRDIAKHRQDLLAGVGAVPPARRPAVAPAPAPALAPPLPLLAQAQLALCEATAHEHAARRAYDFAGETDRARCKEHLVQQRRRRNQAQGRVDSLQHARDALQKAIADDHRALRQARGELDHARTTAAYLVAQAQRAVEQTEAVLARMQRDLEHIAGAEAVSAASHERRGRNSPRTVDHAAMG